MADTTTTATGKDGTKIQTLTRTSFDVRNEVKVDARFVGALRTDQTRITVASALTSNDKQDLFRFQVQSGYGNFGLGVTGTEGVRVEILDRRTGRPVADSQAKDGTTLGDNYVKAQLGKLTLKRGDYILRVTRGDTLASTDKPNYVVQLTLGTKYKVEYDTIEKPAVKIDTSVTPKENLVSNTLLADVGTSFTRSGSIFSLLV